MFIKELEIIPIDITIIINNMDSDGLISPLGSGLPLVLGMIESISCSMYMLRAVTPPADPIPVSINNIILCRFRSPPAAKYAPNIVTISSASWVGFIISTRAASLFVIPILLIPSCGPHMPFMPSRTVLLAR